MGLNFFSLILKEGKYGDRWEDFMRKLPLFFLIGRFFEFLMVNYELYSLTEKL